MRGIERAPVVRVVQDGRERMCVRLECPIIAAPPVRAMAPQALLHAGKLTLNTSVDLHIHLHTSPLASLVTGVRTGSDRRTLQFVQRNTNPARSKKTFGRGEARLPGRLTCSRSERIAGHLMAHKHTGRHVIAKLQKRP